MYALFAAWKPAAALKARFELRTVPLVRHQPGFLSGTFGWDPDTDRAVTHVVFSTEAHARGFGEWLRQSDDGLELMVVAALIADVEPKP